MDKAHHLAPTVKWAQRKDKVYMTVEIRDIKNEKIDLQPATLSFVGESDEKLYEFKIEFFEEVDVEVSSEFSAGVEVEQVRLPPPVHPGQEGPRGQILAQAHQGHQKAAEHPRRLGQVRRRG